MSTLQSRVNPKFTDCPVFKFDPSVGYVHTPQSVIDEYSKKYDMLVAEGKLKASERKKFLKQFEDGNNERKEADDTIKKRFGDDHFYGEIGMPLLLWDRWDSC